MKIFTKILTGALTALGFTACGGVDMYAPPPSAYARIDVTVVDKANDKPICCARVVVKYLDDAKRPNDTLTAWTDGRTSMVDHPEYPADLTYRLIVEDVAHEIYKKDSVDVKFRTTDFKGVGEIMRGSVNTKVTIKLEKKTE